MSALSYAAQLVHTVGVLGVLGVLTRADTSVLDLAHGIVDEARGSKEGPQGLHNRSRVRAEAEERHLDADAMEEGKAAPGAPATTDLSRASERCQGISSYGGRSRATCA